MDEDIPAISLLQEYWRKQISQNEIDEEHEYNTLHIRTIYTLHALTHSACVHS